MRLIITGGGDSTEFDEIDREFIAMLGKDPWLLFIPLAGARSTWKGGSFAWTILAIAYF